MMMPSIFGENLFDDFFDFDYPFRGYQRANTESLMKTDIKEHEHGYELEVSLPGYSRRIKRWLSDHPGGDDEEQRSEG